MHPVLKPVTLKIACRLFVTCTCKSGPIPIKLSARFHEGASACSYAALPSLCAVELLQALPATHDPNGSISGSIS